MRLSRIRGAGRVLAVTAAAALLASCGRVPPKGHPEQERIVWPPPPDPPRIEYVRSVRSPADLGIRKNWLTRTVGYVLHGRQSLGMARPYAVAVTDRGAIAVADADGGCVHVYDVPAGKYRRLVEAEHAALVSPVGIAVDPEGRLYVADSTRAAVFRFGASGAWTDTIGGGGELERPTGLAFDPGRSRLYVVDTVADSIAAYDVAGHRVARFGHRGAGPGEFNRPVAVAVDRAGRIYVTDSLNFRVQVFEPDGTFVRAFGEQGLGPGGFDKAKGIALDADGHVYVVEGLHDVVNVFDAQGRLLTVVGATGNGPGEFGLPAGIHVDGEGRIFVADSANRRIEVFRYLGEPEQRGSGL